ncbi:hypothetical protein CDAR_508951 [Caerostris darwini]|uniref:Uncharacterized protein n=1 Tax=Caerostris darwini TaxID=1538125 RepID=A0AAV4N095_9ARAC|nr:hypothetical protein CDAR_508951 [Caerostris darwini]
METQYSDLLLHNKVRWLSKAHFTPNYENSTIRCKLGAALENKSHMEGLSDLQMYRVLPKDKQEIILVLIVCFPSLVSNFVLLLTSLSVEIYMAIQDSENRK